MVDIEQIIADLNIPASEIVFKEFKDKGLPEAPFVLWTITDNYGGSDDMIFYNRQNVSLELYTKKRISVYADRIETVLNNEIDNYTKSTDYMNTEKLYVTTYSFSQTTKL